MNYSGDIDNQINKIGSIKYNNKENLPDTWGSAFITLSVDQLVNNKEIPTIYWTKNEIPWKK